MPNRISRSKVMILSHLLVAGSVVFWWGSVFAQLLPPASDDVKLRVVQQELDEDAAGRTQKAHAEALAKHFKVEPSVVEHLRTSKQGWGEIAIRLGIAQELTKTNPKTYPTMGDAMQKVGDLRTQQMGWGAIAKELGLALGPVVSEVQRVRQDMRAEAKRAATEGVVTPERALEQSQTEQASQSDRSEKTQRPKRIEKPQRP
jgi:hypothetical protein